MLPTIKKKILTGFPVLLMLFIVIGILIADSGSRYEVTLFKSDNGWGYDILIDRKLYIHQPYIPAIGGKLPFSDRHSARKTGKLIVRKLKDHKSPFVTKEELKVLLKDESLLFE